jgi:hypothetical protein
VRRHTESLVTAVGVAYLLIGLAVLPAPAMFLMFVPRSDLTSISFLMNLGVLLLIFGPCLLIGYAWIRRRKWGRYLLIAYNGIGFAGLSVVFVDRMVSDSTSRLGWAITAFLTILIVLGSLIVLALQKDVRAFMSH